MKEFIKYYFKYLGIGLLIISAIAVFIYSTILLGNFGTELFGNKKGSILGMLPLLLCIPGVYAWLKCLELRDERQAKEREIQRKKEREEWDRKLEEKYSRSA